MNAIVPQQILVPIPFNKLRRSKQNMRTVSPAKSKDDCELVASIRDIGLIQNLCVVQVNDLYEVPAGGRRLGALEYLVKQGEIPDTSPIYCLVVAPEEATNVSLIENHQRMAPHPADTFKAFTNLIDEGRSIGEVAKTYAITENDVNKYLRLGRLHKTIFQKFVKDDLTLDQVMAFASTPDTKLQLAVFKSATENHRLDPRSIRRLLSENKQPATTAMALFVTLDRYRESGGAVEEDLFTDTTMLCDTTLLVSLAENMLNAEAAKIEGWKWVLVSMEGSRVLWDYQRLESVHSEIPVSVVDKLTSLEKMISVLDDIDEDDWTDEHASKYDDLEEQKDALEKKIEDQYSVFRDEDKPYAGCVVTFDQTSGELQILEGLLTNDDMKSFTRKDIVSDEASGDANGTENNNDKPEISAKLKDDLSLYRRSIVSCELGKHTELSHDLLHYQFCHSVLSTGVSRFERVLDIRLDDVSNETSIGDYSSTTAAIEIDKLYSRLDIGWCSLATEVKRFTAFRALSNHKKKALVSFCTAHQLSSGKVVHGKDKLIDLMVKEMEIDFISYWRPNVTNYFGRLTKPLLLALGRKWYGKKWADEHQMATKKSVAATLDAVFQANVGELSEKDQKLSSSWIPAEIAK